MSPPRLWPSPSIRRRVPGSPRSPKRRVGDFAGRANAGLRRHNGKGETLLHVRPLESLDVRVLPGTGNMGTPFWSPDSKSLAFVAEGKLKRIELAEGDPIPLCE